MQNENGVRTSNVEESSTLDHVLGMKGGSTRRQPVDKLAQQLLASGPMRAALPISGSNTLYFATKAAMQAANLSSSAVASNLISAWVYADETVENNGVYKPLMGTPVTWQRVLDLPMQWAEAEQIAGTTANAIKARTGVPVSRSLIVALPITAANTAAPTVSFNGGAALSIVSNNDNPVAAGGLVPPMLVWGFADYDTSKFRLINDQVASAIVAAAEAAASSAKGYRDAAQELKLQAAQSALDAKHYAEQAEETSKGSIEGAFDAAPLVTAAAAADKFFILVDGELKAITKASLGKLFGMPIGTTIMMQGNGNNPPPGYLLHNGAAVTSAYPDLRAWLLANGATVDGNGDPIIEDMGGYFPRGWRPGQVVDSGRVFGSMQQDAFQNHRHPANRVSNATVSVPVNNNQQGPCPYIADGYVNVPMAQANGHGATLPDGDSGAPRTAAETRPVNKTFTYWIKAYAADQVPGSVDFAALANNLQALQTAVNSKGTKRQASITPSGNAFTLNGLPAGVQRVLIKLSGIQIASNGQIVVRLGTSGGVETSAGRYFSKSVGFAATSLQESSLTTGFLLNDASVGSAITLANYGVIELQRHAPGSNSWELSGTMTRGNSGQNIFVGGATLLDELTQIQFTTTAGNIAFSGNSSVAIEWEF